MRFTLRCVQCMVASVFRDQQPASFFALGIQKLVDRWDKYLNKLGQYVEK